jgi:hypothetical protein
MYLILLAVLLTMPLGAQRKPGNQLDNLPSNIEVLAHFGERADITPDNQRCSLPRRATCRRAGRRVSTRRSCCGRIEGGRGLQSAGIGWGRRLT